MLHEYVFAFVNHLQAQASGGARRDRTADPLLAKQVLSQLSYSPKQNLSRGYVLQDFAVRSIVAAPRTSVRKSRGSGEMRNPGGSGKI